MLRSVRIAAIRSVVSPAEPDIERRSGKDFGLRDLRCGPCSGGGPPPLQSRHRFDAVGSIRSHASGDDCNRIGMLRCQGAKSRSTRASCPRGLLMGLAEMWRSAIRSSWFGAIT